MMALNLEEQQYVWLILVSLAALTQIFRHHLQLEALQIKGTQTSKQIADLEEKHTSLCNQIQQWHHAQLAYTPCVASLVSQSLATMPNATELLPMEPAELMPLCLPSSLPQHLQELSELASILKKEYQLCVAQADDALAEI